MRILATLLFFCAIPAVFAMEFKPDGTITFQLRDPKATEVAVIGSWPGGHRSMIKGTNGIWTAAIDPVAPGIWYYSFQVDGLMMIDPENPNIKTGPHQRESFFQIPANPPAIYDFQDVPHGVVREHTYRSKSLGRLRNLDVYTPPGYDQSPHAKYPVLYLFHGVGDIESTWVGFGKAHWILDNLIAQGRAKPMIVVMPNGHADPEKNTAMFTRDLLEDVIPFVEANYRVKKKPANRAIAGLSMGGHQSLAVGLGNYEKFGWVGGFSSSIPTAEELAPALDHPADVNKHLKLLWVSIGDKDSGLKRNQDFTALLKQRGIRYEWHLGEGAHSWPVRRKNLADFAPLLFR